ncbi:hypothetical protein V1499_18345 [Neobacillus sp. SCS-31]|uniref:hypothetical protein n=1 Tax=Neobacillus oceani TaxID=3115292 RepID=UPI0039058C16
MKKKLAFSLFTLILVAIAVIGTSAYFSKSFSSNNNLAHAAKFNVDVVNAQGQAIGNGQFNLGEDLFPGMDPIEAYSFNINKNDTKLPVEYKIDLSTTGALFPENGSSPVNIKMQRNVDNNWVDFDYSKAFKPEKDSESFKILVEWPHGTNDIAFAGATGTVNLQVTATQVDKPAPPQPSKNIVTFKATPNGPTRTTTFKQINHYKNNQGFKVIEIKVEGTGEFERNVGNLTVTGELLNGTTYYRVITDKEYFASSTQSWRSNNVDTLVKGTVLFKGANGPYLSIESNELYDWWMNN